MKKALQILVALLFAFVGIAQAQTVQIGTSENEAYDLPFNTLYYNSFTEQIYDAGEIGLAGTIYYISYYMDEDEAPLSKGVTIYMAHVMKSDFTDINDFVSVTSGDIVYYGTWDMTPGWSTIVLDTPFDYNGMDNLMVAFYVADTDYSTRYFRCTNVPDQKSLSYYSDTYAPNPYDLSAYTGNKSTYYYRPNIRLGFTNCAAPTNVNVTATPTIAHVTWDGVADAFTLQYRLSTVTVWTSVTNITGNAYDIPLYAAGKYHIRVQANCDPDNWANSEFFVYIPESTANWYAYARNSYSGASWQNKYIQFTVQEPYSSNTASMDALMYDINAGTFANGYVWILDNGTGDLLKAPVTNTYHLVGNFETVMTGFSVGSTIWSMAFNPVNQRMYFLEQSGGNFVLKSFELSTPSTVSTHGVIGIEACALAINKEGQAYLLEAYGIGGLYSINLSNAQLTLVGETGLEPYFASNSMAFDMNTGELFLAGYSTSGVGFYYLDTNDGNKMFLGQIGDAYGAEVSSLFMVYDYNAVTEAGAERVNVYPNPASDMLYIDGVEGQQVRVYDNMGRLVVDELYKGHLDISALAQGIYAVTVGDNTVKFVKK